MPIMQAFAIFLCAFFPRALLSVLEPATSGDWTIYQTVAVNILDNGCVSLSDPMGGACLPHWGGNHLPGFPAFVALIWSFSERTWQPVAVAHSAVFALAVVYLFVSLKRARFLSSTTLICTLVVAFSPVTVPWARFTLSETLALSVVVWIAADLCRSLADRHLRLVPLAAAMTVGLFIRYDLALLALPIAFVGFIVHPFWRAIQRGLLMIVIISIPLGAWWARSIAAGLGIAPPMYFLGNGNAAPIGYLDWAKTWATNQYQAPGWWYPIHFSAYSDIIIEAGAYANVEERQHVEVLLKQLVAFEGLQFPAVIDQEFAAIATQRRTAAPLRYWLWLPLQRIGLIWFNPSNSGGWPVSVGWPGGSLDFKAAIEIVRQHPWSVLVKVASASWRIGILAVALLLLALSVRRTASFATMVLWAALLHAIARTAFMGWGFFIESRYLLETIPLLEIAIILSIADLWHPRSSAPNGIRGDCGGKTELNRPNIVGSS